MQQYLDYPLTFQHPLYLCGDDLLSSTECLLKTNSLDLLERLKVCAYTPQHYFKSAAANGLGNCTRESFSSGQSISDWAWPECVASNPA